MTTWDEAMQPQVTTARNLVAKVLIGALNEELTVAFNGELRAALGKLGFVEDQDAPVGSHVVDGWVRRAGHGE